MPVKVKVKRERVDESLKRKRPPPLEFKRKRNVVVRYVGPTVRRIPLFVPQYVPTPMYFLPQPYQVEHRGKNKIVDIMSPITHGVAEGVTVAEEDSQDDCEDDHSIEERDEDKVEAEAEAVAEAEAEAGPDISSEAGDDTCTGDQGTLENHHITSQETNQDIEYKADQEEGEKTCVEANCDGDKKCEEDDDHSHLAIEDGAIPTPNITRDVQGAITKDVQGAITINNHSYEFQFPSRTADTDRKLFLSICNKIWSERPTK
ncbi:hypothetical protein B1J92_L12782g [Nakaseomyces glabratus]|nr:hypothetical protein B1J91_L12782g [Nakaseomyces glabratus]OXB46577.1 hypothetical protein B1J92_L12782g [Nakaseomyces glabratus]